MADADVIISARQLQESNERHAAAFVKQDATIAKQGATIAMLAADIRELHCIDTAAWAKQGATIVQLRRDMGDVLEVISDSHSSTEYSEWFHKIPKDFFGMSVCNVISIYCKPHGKREAYAVLQNAVDKHIVDEPHYNRQIYWLLHHALKHCAIRNRSSHLNAPVTPEEKELPEKAKKRFPNLTLFDHLTDIEKRGPGLLTAATMESNARKEKNDLKVLQAQIKEAWDQTSAQFMRINDIAEIHSLLAKGVPTAFLAI